MVAPVQVPSLVSQLSGMLVDNGCSDQDIERILWRHMTGLKSCHSYWCCSRSFSDRTPCWNYDCPSCMLDMIPDLHIFLSRMDDITTQVDRISAIDVSPERVSDFVRQLIGLGNIDPIIVPPRQLVTALIEADRLRAIAILGTELERFSFFHYFSFP